MREIKFRAWMQNEDDEFYMCYELAFEEYAPINNLLKGVPNLMQYTGLKDKNGVEIYEDDVVIVPSKQTGKELERFVIELNPTASCLNGWASYQIKVIGNIHQDPHLLTK